MSKRPKKVRKTSRSTTQSLKASEASFKLRGQSFAMSTLPPAPTPDLDSINQPKSNSLNANYVTNAIELQAALDRQQIQITLGNNIIIQQNLLINHDVAIDFNGFSIIAEESLPNARILDIHSGEVTLTGRGKIFAMGAQSVAIRVFGAISSGMVDYTHVTVDEDISLFAPDSYGLLVSPNLGVAYGVRVDFSGKIFAQNGLAIYSGIRGQGTHIPIINIKSSAEITVDEVTGIALEASGIGRWQIDSAKLKAATGVYIRGGKLTFMHTQIIASRGPVLLVDESVTENTSLHIMGGSYVSEQDALYRNLSARNIDFTIQDAVLCGADLSTLESAKIDNSEYRTDPASAVTELVDSQTIAELTASTPEKTSPIIANSRLTVSSLPPIVSTLPAAVSEDQANPQSSSAAAASLPARYLPPQSSLTTNPPSIVLAAEPEAIQPLLSSAELIRMWMPEDTTEEGLRDDQTDEQEIVSSLLAESDCAEEAATPAIVPTILDPEKQAACAALQDALNEMKKLRADDYEVGFLALEQSIAQAEKLLSTPAVDLADIRDAAGNLLRAFDGLEERNEFSLSDAELDELFYHGAILSEISHSSPEPPRHTESRTKTSTKSPEGPVTLPVISSTDKLPFIASPPEVDPAFISATSHSPEPDFTVLGEILATISELNLANYTSESQSALLQTLDRAHSILTNSQVAQSEIDELTSSLLAEMSHLQPLHLAHLSNRNPKTNRPEPVIGAILPATMVDEMNPVSTWSSGITMIDENTPFVTDADTRASMLRAMQPWLVGFWELATESLRKKAKSIAAGWRAGIHAYRDTLHSSDAR